MAGKKRWHAAYVDGSHGLSNRGQACKGMVFVFVSFLFLSCRAMYVFMEPEVTAGSLSLAVIVCLYVRECLT